MKPTAVWCNAPLTAAASARLTEGVRARGCELELAPETSGSAPGAAPTRSRGWARAHVAFGQPDAAACARHANLRWVALTSAGYTRFDTPELREALTGRGVALTNASAVFADPCAQQVLAMMLTLGRNLLPAYDHQRSDRAWTHAACRDSARLLTGDTVLLLGFGAIGRRLAELLAPFGAKLYAVRRRTYSERGVHILPEDRLTTALASADHVVNLLPENDSTRNYVNARRLSSCKPGARFYNVGRGTTVDQRALRDALESGRLGAAYLDVTDPEPLPPDDPLWTTPRCYITPHSAGGRHDQDEALVAHFLANLDVFLQADGEWRDRVW